MVKSVQDLCLHEECKSQACWFMRYCLVGNALSAAGCLRTFKARWRHLSCWEHEENRCWAAAGHSLLCPVQGAAVNVRVWSDQELPLLTSLSKFVVLKPGLRTWSPQRINCGTHFLIRIRAQLSHAVVIHVLQKNVLRFGSEMSPFLLCLSLCPQAVTLLHESLTGGAWLKEIKLLELFLEGNIRTTAS